MKKSHTIKKAALEKNHAPLQLTTELIVLSVDDKTAQCRVLHSGESLRLKSPQIKELAPGVCATVEPERLYSYAGDQGLAAKILSVTLDVRALGLTPLRLTHNGQWNPRREYWRDTDHPPAKWEQEIISRGVRTAWEMEYVVPVADSGSPRVDPIADAADLMDAGMKKTAREILMSVCEKDLRCLDAHAYLGNLAFDFNPHKALQHYEVGVRIGELSFPKGFDGVLPWEMIDNRPFLRCLHGYGLCLWRLGDFKKSAAVFQRMLWHTPTDNLGARFLLDAVKDKKPWAPDA